MAPLTPARRLTDAAEGSPRFAESLAVPEGLSNAGDALRALATELKWAPIGPSADFRAALRTRLVAVASVTPVAPAPPDSLRQRAREWASGWRAQRGLRTATAGLAAVVAIGGMGLAGSRSLPGEPFYAVKRAAEGVQLALAHGDVARGIRHLQFARVRLHEVEALSGYHAPAGASGPSASGVAFDGARVSRIRATLREMDVQTDAGAKLLTTAFLVHHDAGALRTLTTFSVSQANRLQGVLANLDAEEQPPAINSLSLVLTVQARATVLLDSATMAPNTPTGPANAALGPAVPVLTTPTPTSPNPHARRSPGTTNAADSGGGAGSASPGASPAPTAPAPSSSPTSDQDPSASPAPTATPQPTASPTPTPIVVALPLPIPSVCVPSPVLPTVCIVHG